ncbi:hypothetical protein CAPTEDRAFT_5874 [Capitella teleta]|uniref:General vesicular transport factor p115 n=1 Tax=Capitella teleta TaxID=283909 RepID=R7UG30_CAPTE|nr:hypothetical protein CAPTEDRAFT_5874 [Capitella teleta]|eukprot:ELU02247.1 hypothetical protein CAPTEDRAFT_5874 [Capitella teleta]
MDLFRKYLTGPQEGAQPTGADTVERLCDRVQSSTLIDDRRDAVRALKSLSRKFRLEVGAQAMGILIGILQTDRTDAEIVGYALDTLCNVLSTEPADDEDEAETAPQLPEDIGSQFTEMFVKEQENVVILLSLLEEYDFHIRWPTVRLLTMLLANRSKEIQDIILSSPMGVSKLMDLLSDSREIIRNDGLLLLIQLTRGSTNIQKIVAFENAFERLLSIISEEGDSDGGIVVEDCFLLLLNLLKNNSSNQNFFKEGSYIQRLPAFFELPPPDKTSEGWSAQKVTNIHLMLQLVRTMVSPNNPMQQTTLSQKVMHNCGLLEKLCNILMASGVPADVLTETINTVSEVIRGSQGNQEYFASVLAPSNPPRPAIVVLLMSMVNEKQPFVLRCAVLYCFQSFLYKNELGQSQIIQTLLPSTAEVNTISAGQLLCGGLFSSDSLSTWFAAVALLHAMVDNVSQKEQLLRVQLATSLGNPPVSLLQQCTNILAQGGKVQTRMGLLMLLCHWLSHCPITVTHFLNNNANVPFLISQISSSEGDEMELVIQGLCAFLLGLCVLYNQDQVQGNEKAYLRQIIEKRIGVEQFTDKLTQVSKHESYSRAAKRPEMNYKRANEVFFDYEFTRLFRGLENEVLKAVSPSQDNEVEDNKRKVALDQHESIVKQFQDLIREQDGQLNSLRAELSESQGKISEADSKLEEFLNQVQQLKDQNALLKAQRGQSSLFFSLLSNALVFSQVAVAHKVRVMSRNCKLKRAAEIEKLRSQLMAGNTEDTANTAILSERNALSLKVAELEEELSERAKEKSKLQDDFTALDQKALDQEKSEVEIEKMELQTELDSTKKEQEDLLVLLADQDTKLSSYKTKLKDLGQNITDDEDDDLDDDDDEDDD